MKKIIIILSFVLYAIVGIAQKNIKTDIIISEDDESIYGLFNLNIGKEALTCDDFEWTKNVTNQDRIDAFVAYICTTSTNVYPIFDKYETIIGFYVVRPPETSINIKDPTGAFSFQIDVDMDWKEIELPTFTPYDISNGCDATKNWSMQVYYDEEGNPYSANKTFIDNLGRTTQVQSKNFTTNKVMGREILYDAFGRPALYTLPAYTNNSILCYKDNFITNADGNKYDIDDFDKYTVGGSSTDLGGVNNPQPIDDGAIGSLGWYYSNNNTLEDHTPASNFPYSRVMYDNTPAGAVQKVANVGEEHKMGSGHETQSYSMVDGDELRYVFGVGKDYMTSNENRLMNGISINDNSSNIRAIKTIVIDENGKEAIQYITPSGLNIATCISGATDECSRPIIAHTVIYSGSKTTTIHYPKTYKSAGIDMTVFYNSNNINEDDFVVSLIDKKTNYKLQKGIDYTINYTTGTAPTNWHFVKNKNPKQIYPSTFSSMQGYNSNWNPEDYYRNGYPVHISFIGSYAQSSDILQVSYENNGVGMRSFDNSIPKVILTHTLDYSNWAINYYDDKTFGVSMSVPPKGIDCQFMPDIEPTITNINANYPTFENLYDGNMNIIGGAFTIPKVGLHKDTVLPPPTQTLQSQTIYVELKGDPISDLETNNPYIPAGCTLGSSTSSSGGNSPFTIDLNCPLKSYLDCIDPYFISPDPNAIYGGRNIPLDGIQLQNNTVSADVGDHVYRDNYTGAPVTDVLTISDLNDVIDQSGSVSYGSGIVSGAGSGGGIAYGGVGTSNGIGIGIPHYSGSGDAPMAFQGGVYIPQNQCEVLELRDYATYACSNLDPDNLPDLIGAFKYIKCCNSLGTDPYYCECTTSHESETHEDGLHPYDPLPGSSGYQDQLPGLDIRGCMLVEHRIKHMATYYLDFAITAVDPTDPSKNITKYTKSQVSLANSCCKLMWYRRIGGSVSFSDEELKGKSTIRTDVIRIKVGTGGVWGEEVYDIYNPYIVNFTFDPALYKWHFLLKYAHINYSNVREITPILTPNHTMQEKTVYDEWARVIGNTTPDEGLSEVKYDDKGRVRFTQNANQRVVSAFSYVNYDKYNRVIETGEYHSQVGSTLLFNTATQGMMMTPGYTALSTPSALNAPITAPASSLADVSHIVYDRSSTAIPLTSLASNYQSSFNANMPVYSYNEHSQTWYGYDVYGRPSWTVQHVNGISTSLENRLKTIDYSYDLLGNVKEISYQKYNNKDNYTTHYQYDRDKRLEKVMTSNDGDIANALQHASYQYYLHGPLKRTVLADYLQGIDYSYTLHGWLKAINGNDLNDSPPTDLTWQDPLQAINSGSGGISVGGGSPPVHNPDRTDVFSEVLHYYPGDYKRAGTYLSSYDPQSYVPSPSNPYYAGASTTTSGLQPLDGKPAIPQSPHYYNGMIQSALYQRSTTTYSTGIGVPGEIPAGSVGTVIGSDSRYLQLFVYDDKYRLSASINCVVNTMGNYNKAFDDMASSQAMNVSATNEYLEWRHSYDLNGNLKTLKRNGTNAGHLERDRLVYDYVSPTSNRLDRVQDLASLPSGDVTLAGFKHQAINNYVYDAGGQVIEDHDQNIKYIYNSFGKVKRVTNNSDVTKMTILYDESGQKLCKQLYNSTGTTIEKEIYYIAGGLAVYEKLTSKNHPENVEYALMGLDKLGSSTMEIDHATHDRSSIHYRYDLKDHLGNIRATIERERVGDAIQLVSKTDYYAWGGTRPGTAYNPVGAVGTRYGYQGQELEGLLGNTYSFELRMYQTDIGRWMSPDPYRQHYSPYLAMGNNPVMFVDPDGGQEAPAPRYFTSTRAQSEYDRQQATSQYLLEKMSTAQSSNGSGWFKQGETSPNTDIVIFKERPGFGVYGFGAHINTNFTFGYTSGNYNNFSTQLSPTLTSQIKTTLTNVNNFLSRSFDWAASKVQLPYTKYTESDLAEPNVASDYGPADGKLMYNGVKAFWNFSVDGINSLLHPKSTISTAYNSLPNNYGGLAPMMSPFLITASVKYSQMGGLVGILNTNVSGPSTNEEAYKRLEIGHKVIGGLLLLPLMLESPSTSKMRFSEKLFLSEKFGITSERFANSITGVKGTWNNQGGFFKMGWSTRSKYGGGIQLRIGIGSKASNANQALIHIYVPKTFVPNSFANPSIQVKKSLFKIGL